MRAVTETGPTVPNSPKSQVIQNLFDLMKLVSTPETIQFFDDQYNGCTIRYGDMKKQLAEDMVNYLTPIREKIKELSADDAKLSQILGDGGAKARASAAQTIKDVREIIGIKSF